MKKFNTQGNIANKPHCGRPKKLTEREERRIIRKIRQDPFTSGSHLALVVATQFQKEVHPELCRRLRNNGLHARVLRRKSFISKKNKVICLQFAEKFLYKNNSSFTLCYSLMRVILTFLVVRDVKMSGRNRIQN